MSDGYFGSAFRIGTGPARRSFGVNGGRSPSSNSEKLRIQLPLALVRFGRFTCIVYTSLPERTFSGGKLGSRALTFGGPRRELLRGSEEFGGVRFKVFKRLPDGAMPPRLDGAPPPVTLIAAGSDPELDSAPAP